MNHTTTARTRQERQRQDPEINEITWQNCGWSTLLLERKVREDHLYIKAGELALLLALISRANPSGKSWYTREALAEMIRAKSTKTVTRLHQQLQAHGLLKVNQMRGRAGKKNVYILNIDKILNYNTKMAKMSHSMGHGCPVPIKDSHKESNPSPPSPPSLVPPSLPEQERDKKKEKRPARCRNVAEDKKIRPVPLIKRISSEEIVRLEREFPGADLAAAAKWIDQRNGLGETIFPIRALKTHLKICRHLRNDGGPARGRPACHQPAAVQKLATPEEKKLSYQAGKAELAEMRKILSRPRRPRQRGISGQRQRGLEATGMTNLVDDRSEADVLTGRLVPLPPIAKTPSSGARNPMTTHTLTLFLTLTLTLALILAPPQADAQTPTCVKWGWGDWEDAPMYEGGPLVKDSVADLCLHSPPRPTQRRRSVPVAADGSSPCNGTVPASAPRLPVLKTGRNAGWATNPLTMLSGIKDCADTRPRRTLPANPPANPPGHSGDKDVCKFDDGVTNNTQRAGAALLFNKDAHNGSEENKPCILRSLREGRHIHLAWLHPTPADREYQRGYGGIPIPLVPGSRFKHWLGQLSSRNNGKWCHFDEDACRYEHTTFTCDEIKKTVPDPDNPGHTKEVSYSPKRYKTNTPGTTTWEMHKIDKTPACDLKYYQLWSGTHLPLNLCTPAKIVDYDGDGDGCKDEVKPKPECEPADQPCNTPVVPPVTPPVVTPPTPTCDWETGTWRTDPHNSCRQVRDVTPSAACGTNTPTGAKPAASRDDPSAGPSCCAKWKTDFNDPAVPGNPQEGWRMGFDSVANIPACFGNQQVTRQCETDKDFCKKSGNQSVCRKNTPAQKPNPNDWLPALKPDEICKGDKQTQTRKADTHPHFAGVGITCPDETRELEGTKVCAKEDGVCGADPGTARCDAGTEEGFSAGPPKDTWTCKGIDGGKDAMCEVVHGVCAASPTGLNQCDAGNAINEDSVNKTWYCDSTPAGVATARSVDECSFTKNPGTDACGSSCPTSSPPIWTESGNRCCATWTNGNNIGCFSKDATSCAAPVCGTTLKTCSNGLPVPTSTDTWMCISMGPDGKGASVSCSTTAVAGVCGTTVGACTTGIPAAVDTGAGTWTCEGRGGGSDASCPPKGPKGQQCYVDAKTACENHNGNWTGMRCCDSVLIDRLRNAGTPLPSDKICTVRLNSSKTWCNSISGSQWIPIPTDSGGTGTAGMCCQ